MISRLQSLLLPLATAMLLALPAAALLADEVVEMEWDSLIPEDFRPEALFAEFDDIDEIDDDDPRAIAFMDKLMELWENAPIIEELDGMLIRIPGFVVPLEGDGQKVSEFLLVPYYGACIHVPPPPANQTLYVQVPTADAVIREAFDTVWVTGRLSAKPLTTDLATAGYQIQATLVEPYDEELPDN